MERDYRTIIQIRIATSLIVSKRGGHLQLGKGLKDYYSNMNGNSVYRFEKGRYQQLNKILKDYYSNTNCDRACCFENGRTSAVEK